MKQILIFFLIVYFLVSFSGKIIRFLYWLTGGSPAKRNVQKQKRKGDISIEYAPEHTQRKGYSGGEYIDYEEVD